MMKLEKKDFPKELQKNKFFTAIPEDKVAKSIPTMRAVIIADIEDLEEVESITNRCP
ncbi:hypothetical protein [Legionella sp. WA2022007384]